MIKAQSSLVRGDEGSNRPNSQTNLVIVLQVPSLFYHFLQTPQLTTWAYNSNHLLLLKSSMIQVMCLMLSFRKKFLIAFMIS